MDRAERQNSIMRTFGPWVIGNFLLCAAIHVWAGGDALGGHVENGVYFLESRGRFIETSAWFWNVSAVYMRVTMLSVGVMFVLGVIQQMFFLRL